MQKNKKKKVIAFIDGPSIFREGYKLDNISNLLHRIGEPSIKKIYLARHTGEQLIKAVSIGGYQPIVCETDRIDSRLIIDASSSITENYQKCKDNIFVLGSNKFDFFPLVCLAKDKGVETLVFFRSNGYSEGLKNVAHKYKILEEEIGKNDEINIIEEEKERMLVFIDGPNILRGTTKLDSIDKLIEKEGVSLIKKVYLSRHTGEGLIQAVSIFGYEPIICETDDVDPTLIADASYFIKTNKEIHNATIFALGTGDFDFSPLIHLAKRESFKTLVFNLPQSNQNFEVHGSEALKNYADIYRVIELEI